MDAPSCERRPIIARQRRSQTDVRVKRSVSALTIAQRHTIRAACEATGQQSGNDSPVLTELSQLPSPQMTLHQVVVGVQACLVVYGRVVTIACTVVSSMTESEATMLIEFN